MLQERSKTPAINGYNAQGVNLNIGRVDSIVAHIHISDYKAVVALLFLHRSSVRLQVRVCYL